MPRELQRVASEFADLVRVEFDDVAPALAQPRAHGIAALRVGDEVKAPEREVGAHAQHHVGVVAGPALRVGGGEGHGLEVEMRAEALQRHRVGAVRLRGVGDAADVVQHHGARAFEGHAVVLQARVVDHVLHAVAGLEHLDDVAAPLAPPVGGVHGVERHMAARVGGEPVVREHGVGRRWVVAVEQVHAHPGGLQGGGGLGYLGMGLRGHAGGRGRALEGVVGGGLGVGVEVVRAHHGDGGGGLEGGRRHGCVRVVGAGPTGGRCRHCANSHCQQKDGKLVK